MRKIFLQNLLTIREICLSETLKELDHIAVLIFVNDSIYNEKLVLVLNKSKKPNETLTSVTD